MFADHAVLVNENKKGVGQQSWREVLKKLEKQVELNGVFRVQVLEMM